MPFKQSSPITIEELRECPEFVHLDDDIAKVMIDTIREFCVIIANQYDITNPEQLGGEEY